MTKYKKYLKSKEWKQIKIDLLQIHGFKCVRCHSVKKPNLLHVHHLTYERLGKEEPEDVELLCSDCHLKEHGLDKKGNKIGSCKKQNKNTKKLPHVLNEKEKLINERYKKMRDKFGFGNI